MAGTGDSIAIRVAYEEPFVWWDAARRRERLGSLRGATEAALPIVDMHGMPAVPVRLAMGWNDEVPPPVERLHGGYRWQPLEDGLDGPMGLAALRRFVDAPAGPLETLRTSFDRSLSTAAGEAARVGPGSRALDAAVERFPADAEDMAREFVSHMLACDGRDCWIRVGRDHGSPGRPRNVTGLFDARLALLAATEVPGVDGEIERLSAPLRRALARDHCGSLGRAGMPDALRATEALCRALCDRLPSRSVRWARVASYGDCAREGLAAIEPTLPDPTLPEEDAEILALLGPSGP